MKKRSTIKKRYNTKRRSISKRYNTKKRSNISKLYNTKRRYNTKKRSISRRSNISKRNSKKMFYGGEQPRYPDVYGIENKSVLYPISDYGIPAGFFDPPVDSNPQFGNPPQSSNSGPHSSELRYLGRGGGSPTSFAPQPLVDFSRSLTGGVHEIVNGFGGYTNPDNLNYRPYIQPIDNTITVL